MTSNPFVIMLINMTVVFGVLYGLSLVIRLIKIVDPTKKKIIAEDDLSKKKIAPNVDKGVESESATTSTSAQPVSNDDETFILIAAAIAAYGYSPSQIVSIRTVGGEVWRQTARVEAVQARNQMF